MIELCPGCGGVLPMYNFSAKSVVCFICGMTGPTASNERKAVELWNKLPRRKVEGKRETVNQVETELEYKLALIWIDYFMDADSGSPNGAELERLSVLVEAYEEKHFPIPPPTPEEAAAFRAEQEAHMQPSLIKGD